MTISMKDYRDIRRMMTKDELWWIETMTVSGLRNIHGRNNVKRPWHAVYDQMCDDVPSWVERQTTGDDTGYNAPHEWELIENPWVLISEDEYRSERY